MASAEDGTWLNILSVPSLGTKESLHIALGLHLGAVVVDDTCVCGDKVDIYSIHGCLVRIVVAISLVMQLLMKQLYMPHECWHTQNNIFSTKLLG